MLEKVPLVKLAKELNHIDLEIDKLQLEKEIIINEINRRFPNMIQEEEPKDIGKKL